MMAVRSIFKITDASLYAKWIRDFDTIDRDDIAYLDRALKALPAQPRIAIVPLSRAAFDPARVRGFKSACEKQIYRQWSLFESSDASSFSSSVIDAAGTTDFVLPLPFDAVLPPHSLAVLALAIAKAPYADILYADQDMLKEGQRSQPLFKTDWDPFFILGCNAIGVPALYRSDAIKRAGLKDLDDAPLDNFLHALALNVSEATSPDRIVHIPAVLCHRTRVSDWDKIESRKHVAAHLSRCGLKAAGISAAPLAPQCNQVRFAMPDPAPLVSIIVPTRDHAGLIQTCADGLLKRTDYAALELIIVDNGSVAPDALAALDALKSDPRVRVLRDDGPFNYSRLNNLAVASAKGEILVLLNDDVEVLHPDWLKEVVSLISLPGIGIVGTKLLYPDTTVQHAGVSFGPDKFILHQMRLAPKDEPGPRAELALLRSVSAVTAACMALRRDLYIDVGGLDDRNLKVAYNDIDLCRRVAEKGLAILWTPSAELLHHECASRGQAIRPDQADREASEGLAFWSKHPAFYEAPDPFHNPQIEFKQESVDFARPPRRHPLRVEFKRRPEPGFLY